MLASRCMASSACCCSSLRSCLPGVLGWRRRCKGGINPAATPTWTSGSILPLIIRESRSASAHHPAHDQSIAAGDNTATHDRFSRWDDLHIRGDDARAGRGCAGRDHGRRPIERCARWFPAAGDSVNTSGGQVVVQTQAATLEDAIQQGEVVFSRRLSPRAGGAGVGAGGHAAAIVGRFAADHLLYGDEGRGDL